MAMNIQPSYMLEVMIYILHGLTMHFFLNYPRPGFILFCISNRRIFDNQICCNVFYNKIMWRINYDYRYVKKYEKNLKYIK